MAKFIRSELIAHVANVKREPNRQRRQRAAMNFTRDLLGNSCTDVKFTIQQLVKLWNMVKLPR
jgi:hypothetical protein